MRKWTVLTLGLATILMCSTAVYAQGRFELNAWSISNTPAVAGMFSGRDYALMSGMSLVSATATPMPVTPEPVTPTPETPTGQDTSYSIYVPLVNQ